MNPPGAWDVFAPYSGLHALALVVCALLIAAPSLAGRRLQKNAEATLRRTLAALAVCYWLAYNIWWNWNGLDLRTGLPLQICDFNGLVAPLALMTAALTLQAFIQPALTAGPALLVFWAFWAAHTIIAACALYDIAVLGFRPGWNDLGRALAASAVYVALVVPINLWLGSNYGYIGNPADIKEIPPFVDALGPWPQRAIILLALAPLGFVVVLLPWLVAARHAALAAQDMRG
jgi:hypothetical integral membrane protein (TIGR02206 family)